MSESAARLGLCDALSLADDPISVDTSARVSVSDDDDEATDDREDTDEIKFAGSSAGFPVGDPDIARTSFDSDTTGASGTKELSAFDGDSAVLLLPAAEAASLPTLAFRWLYARSGRT